MDSVQFVFGQPVARHDIETVVIGQTTVHNDEIFRRQGGRNSIESACHNVANFRCGNHWYDVLGGKEVLDVFKHDEIVCSDGRIGREQVCSMDLTVDECRKGQRATDVKRFERLELEAIKFLQTDNAFLARFPFRCRSTRPNVSSSRRIC